ncbi:UDP-N-acetylmuramate dehydrogenase [Desulfosoma caldarium]|uniref:UDP-N-acetylenolpyruvoylglucosamine reductase n=1 Tax=Desulfosoma caldarium TaxID=610254 RepID=A0A3N1UQ45_9BACT|nr:UDP-N-acetylmuramate dehydrogenase [Desulfosoma caldarium]ROQ93254.1 UDP-N-acetylmuramate dehydrogenase [Desulfosoma caldarium]
MEWTRLLGDLGEDVEVQWNVPASRLSTFRVGGSVQCVVQPKTEASLKAVLQRLRGEGVPWTILGRGSNVLLPDGLWHRVVILLDRCCTQLRWKPWDHRSGTMTAGAGIRLAQLLKLSMRHGWTGLEFLAGIPASVGGAVMMNAGTRKGSIADVLQRVRILDKDLQEQMLPRTALPMGYRCGGLPQDAVVLEADFRVTEAMPHRVARKIARILRERRQNQPLRWPSAGCVFKNPGSQSAGALIDRAGFKGFRIGDAEVSPVHANWIVNRGQATRDDVLHVIEAVRQGVRERFGVDLELEVQVLE